MSSIGKRLKEARLYRCKKTKDVAEYLNISDNAYRYYEKDERDIGAKRLSQLCDYLNVSANYILGLSDEIDLTKQNTNESEVKMSNTEMIDRTFENLTDIQKSVILDYAKMFEEENRRNELHRKVLEKVIKDDKKVLK